MTQNPGKPPDFIPFDPTEVDQLLETGCLFEVLATPEASAWVEAEKQRWIGLQVGPFEISEYLGSGGMSLVYVANRCDGQFEQKVAIKVLRASNGLHLVQRFERERRLLASLEHPGITQIVESGTIDGQPWLAMELVQGLPIDRFCDDHKLSVGARLELFVRVAQAVQYAHGQLIVHRDLKPSNILVDARGQPKLLDFGIAKALQEDSLELTGSALLMTPQYASPEQVLGSPVGIGSDVYQLGLLLYRLLTGFNANALRNASVAEIKAAVVDRETQTPSSHFDEPTADHDLETIAHLRSTTVDRLCRDLKGDLATIILCALKKDSSQRYGTVQQLIGDIENFQNHRPITARPSSIWYRSRRFVRRHRAAILAGAVTGLLVIGLSIAAAMSWRLTIEAQRQALEEATAAQEIGAFLISLLEQADPSISGGDELTASELLDQSATRLDELDGSPAVQARLLEVLAAAYDNLGQSDRAEPLARQALEARQRLGNREDIIVPLRNLAVIRKSQGDIEHALTLARSAVDTAMEVGADSITQAQAHMTLSIVLFENDQYGLEREHLNAALDQLDGLTTTEARLLRSEVLHSLGQNSIGEGNYADAQGKFESALALIGNKPRERVAKMMVLRDLGYLRTEMGDFAQGAETLGDSLALARRIYGDVNWNLISHLLLLGRTYCGMNQCDAAEPLFLEALEIGEKTIGTSHGDYARALYDYSRVLLRRGDFEALRAAGQEAAATAAEFYGAEHRFSVVMRKHLAAMDFYEGRFLTAETELQNALPTIVEAFGTHTTITFQTEVWIATTQFWTGGFERMRLLLDALDEKSSQIAGGEFVDYRDTLILWSRVHLLTNSSSTALEYAERALTLHHQITPVEDFTLLAPLFVKIKALVQIDPLSAQQDITKAISLVETHADLTSVRTQAFLSELAVAIAEGGKAESARMLCQESTSFLRDSLPSTHPLLGFAGVNCAEVSLRSGDRDRAASLLSVALPSVSDAMGKQSWYTHWAASLQAIAKGGEADVAGLKSSLQIALADDSPLVKSLATIP